MVALMAHVDSDAGGLHNEDKETLPRRRTTTERRRLRMRRSTHERAATTRERKMMCMQMVQREMRRAGNEAELKAWMSEERNLQTLEVRFEAARSLPRSLFTKETGYIHKLDASRQEKESSVLAQNVAASCPDGKYSPATADHLYEAELTQRVRDLGDDVFGKIAMRQSFPGRPHKSGNTGFYVEDDRVLAFRGVSGLDLALVWHMLLIPTLDALNANREPTSSEAPRVTRHWVFDLEPQDLPILRDLRDRGEAFVRANRAYFRRQWAGADLKGHDIDYWLQPENFQFGFHAVPTVGYLHCHLLVGPLTEFGYTPKYRSTWVPLERVVRVLEQGRSCASLMRPALPAQAEAVHC